MRVLVLGGTQFIGAAAVRALVARGHRVTCYHRGRHQAELPAAVERLLGERDDLLARAPELARGAPEALLDMRCMSEADAERTRALALALGCPRVVVASSCDVYRAFGVVLGSEPGPLEPVPLREEAALRTREFPYRRETPRALDDPERWQDEYEKQRVERLLLDDGALRATVVRLPMVHGPADPRRRVGAWLRLMRPDRPRLVLGAREAAWRPCRGYVDDAGRALALALETPAAAGRIYHLADPPVRQEAWVAAIARAAGWPGRIEVLPEERLPEPLRTGYRLEQHLDLDSGRIAAELGWRPEVDPQEALARTVAWERGAPSTEPGPAEREADAAREAAADAL